MPNWIFNPIMFQIGPFTAHWYGFMYALSFLTGYIYLKKSAAVKTLLTGKQIDSLMLCIMLGIILGGRIGYILFYNLNYYLGNLLKIFAVWEGGMSFHGGLIGTAIALLLFCRKNQIALGAVSDIIVRFAPIGIFLVKIGNFINAELYGRVASSFCIIFPTDPLHCRYPSQLLEAFLEGIVLFLILFFIGKSKPRTGLLSSFFLIGYATFRIIIEFFREPDAHIGFLFEIITEGQLLSALMLLIGLIVLFKVTRKNE